MNNTIMRKVVVGSGYQPLAAVRTVTSCTISCPPTNGGTIYFRGDDGSDVPWTQGEWHEFVAVNLADIQVKGTPGDVVTVIGGTW